MKNFKSKKKTVYKRKIVHYLLFLGFFLFSANYVIADSNGVNALLQGSPIEIKGQAKLDNGEPAAGITVKVKNGTAACQTDANGNFTLTLPGLPCTLVFTCISFDTKEVHVTKKEFLNVSLRESDHELNEAVVIGYQTVTKRATHGAVSSITLKDIDEISAPSVDVMLQGLIPGMNIQTNTGAPGARTSISIRGNTSLDGITTGDPLIVLDGVPVDPSVVGFSTTSTNYFSNINPSDIESIHVLKDASGASIYGSRAANGVIQIVTKRGKSGKPRISFNSSLTLNMKPALPKVYAGVTERRQKLGIFAAAGDYMQNSNLPLILTDSLNAAFNNNTDWFGEFYKQSISQDYNLSISGGDDNANYRISGGYYDQDGTIRGTGYQRFSFTGNFSNRISRILLNTAVSYTKGENKTPFGSNTITSALNMSLENMPSSLLYLNDIDRSVLLGQYGQTRNDNGDESFRFSEYITVNLLKPLSFNTQFSYSTMNSRLDYFSPASISTTDNAYASSTASKSTTTDLSTYLNYDDTFGDDHHLMGVVGIETQKSKYESTYAYGKYLSTDDVKVVSGVAQENKDGSSSFSESALAAYFARAQYYFKDRYSLSASIRRDGSSKFSSDKRWGYFPALGAFWIASDENFMDWSKKYLTMLKFRTSYGETGKQPGSSNYGYLSLYQNPGSYDGSVVTTPTYYDGIAQKDFTWEKTKEWNLGMDVDILNSRYFFQADVYSRETDGLFYTLSLPATSGYDNYNTNAVGIRNSGVELSFRANNVLPSSLKDWGLMFGGNINYNKNIITKLPHNNRTLINSTTGKYLSVGSPINQFRMAVYNGVFSTMDDIPIDPYTGQYYKGESGEYYKPGDAFWVDVDGNYQWVSYKDLTIAGDPNPKWNGGVNSSLRYKNWNLDVFCSFTFDRDIWNQSAANTLQNMNMQFGADEYGLGYSNTGRTAGGDWYGPKDFIARRMLIDLAGYNFWKQAGDKADYPSFSPFTNAANFYAQSTMFLEDGSYFKVNNITLSYTFPAIKQLYVNSLRLSLSAQNVAIIKNCKAADPQNVTVDGVYTGNGYGLSRSFVFKLLVDF